MEKNINQLFSTVSLIRYLIYNYICLIIPERAFFIVWLIFFYL